MDEEALIEMVKGCPFLYDLSDSRYSNNGMRSNAWAEIAEDMGKNAEDCKSCWRKLRENYRKAMALRKTKSGQAAPKKRAWKYEEEMAFLSDHFQDRSTLSNVSDSASSQDSLKESPPRDTPRHGDNDHDDRNIDDDDVDDLNDDGRENQGPKSISRRGPVVNVKKNDTAPKSSKASNQQKDVATALMQYLNNKPQKKTTEEKKEAEKKTPEQKEPEKPQSALMHFFVAMAQTVETLPTKYQVEVKSKVFGIVNEYEARVLKTSTQRDESRASYQHDDDHTMLFDLPNLYRDNEEGMDTDARSHKIVTEQTSELASNTFYAI